MLTFEQIRKFMERQGIPGRDPYDLPGSDKTFPDGAHYRIEIAGVERATTMEAMIDEARKRSLTIHRAIATVGGSTFCAFEIASIVNEVMQRYAPGLRISAKGPSDLVLPKPNPSCS